MEFRNIIQKTIIPKYYFFFSIIFFSCTKTNSYNFKNQELYFNKELEKNVSLSKNNNKLNGKVGWKNFKLDLINVNDTHVKYNYNLIPYKGCPFIQNFEVYIFPNYIIKFISMNDKPGYLKIYNDNSKVFYLPYNENKDYYLKNHNKIADTMTNYTEYLTKNGNYYFRDVEISKDSIIYESEYKTSKFFSDLFYRVNSEFLEDDEWTQIKN